jgi:hypothetical protein
MIVLDVLYTALATILVMALLQIVTFFVTRMLYPPEPKIVYRDVMVPQPQIQQSAPQIQQQMPPPALTQQSLEELKLPEYEPRQQTSTGLRLDPQLPSGIQETASLRN